MRNLKPIIIIAFLAGILSWLVAWWMIAAVSFVVTVNHKLKPRDGFLSGFIGVALLWLGFVLWRDIPNEHILANRLVGPGLLPLPNGWMLMLLTVILGGLIGGLAGWSGAIMNKAFRK
ncbi:MAG: hypothetical protein JST82_13500 [Bacteroidetes bacterium]|nr:hypothetical protein [Bacteroidota bacterium]